jgi:hypothetical protein
MEGGEGRKEREQLASHRANLAGAQATNQRSTVTQLDLARNSVQSRIKCFAVGRSLFGCVLRSKTEKNLPLGGVDGLSRVQASRELCTVRLRKSETIENWKNRVLSPTSSPSSRFK